MFQKYFEFIKRSVSSLGVSNSDISIKSYIEVVLNSIWLVIVYALIAIGVVGLFYAPYFIYSNIIVKRVKSKFKDTNDKILELDDEFGILYKEYYSIPDEILDNYIEGELTVREEYHEKRRIISEKISELVEEKDYSEIWKAYLLASPFIMIYMAFVIPLMLIVIDLFFTGLSTTTAILIIAGFIIYIGSITLMSFYELQDIERFRNIDTDLKERPIFM